MLKNLIVNFSVQDEQFYYWNNLDENENSKYTSHIEYFPQNIFILWTQ
jgi:hypothetical protein